MLITQKTIFALAWASMLLHLCAIAQCEYPRPDITPIQVGRKKSEQPNEKVAKEPDFEILTKDCTSRKTCLVFVYADLSMDQEQRLTKIVETLKEKYSDSQKLVIYYFGDRELADAFAKGHREPRELDQRSEAVFVRDAGGEYLEIKRAGPNRDKTCMFMKQQGKLSVARKFIWQNWESYSKAKLEIEAVSKEGEKSVSSYEIEIEEADRRRLEVSIEREIANRKPGPRTSKKRLRSLSKYSVFEINRIEKPKDGLAERRVIPKDSTIPSSSYLLRFKDADGKMIIEF